jgi:hypothetical protein
MPLLVKEQEQSSVSVVQGAHEVKARLSGKAKLLWVLAVWQGEA